MNYACLLLCNYIIGDCIKHRDVEHVLSYIVGLTSKQRHQTCHRPDVNIIVEVETISWFTAPDVTISSFVFSCTLTQVALRSSWRLRRPAEACPAPEVATGISPATARPHLPATQQTAVQRRPIHQWLPRPHPTPPPLQFECPLRH